MGSIDACSNEPNVEDTTPNDVEGGYYCPRLVDHSELKPLNVSTSFHPKNETQLVIAGGMEALHDVGILLLFPLTKLNIS
jgi:hypothetical protein